MTISPSRQRFSLCNAHGGPSDEIRASYTDGDRERDRERGGRRGRWHRPGGERRATRRYSSRRRWCCGACRWPSRWPSTGGPSSRPSSPASSSSRLPTGPSACPSPVTRSSSTRPSPSSTLLSPPPPVRKPPSLAPILRFLWKATLKSLLFKVSSLFFARPNPQLQNAVS